MIGFTLNCVPDAAANLIGNYIEIPKAQATDQQILVDVYFCMP